MGDIILGLLIGLVIGWNVPMPPWAKYIWVIILERLGKNTDVK